jgi:hypothetical protein
MTIFTGRRSYVSGYGRRLCQSLGMRPNARSAARVIQATVVAATASGAPSTLYAWVTDGGVSGAVRSGLDSTRAVGSLLPPGRPGLLRGALVHCVISAGAGVLLARLLPRRHSAAWGAIAGGAMGGLNVGVIGRRFPFVRALPVMPQIADNVAFGALFAAIADRH